MRLLIIGVALCACTPAQPRAVQPIQPIEPASEPEAKPSVDDAAESKSPCGIVIDPITPTTHYEIAFDVNSAKLHDDQETCCRVLSLADALRGHPEWTRVAIEVHSDERGNDQYNATLSLDRARALRTALASLGIDQQRVLAIGFGEWCPLDPAHTPAAWAKNRRVVISVLQPTGGSLSCNVRPVAIMAGPKGVPPPTPRYACASTRP